jgi:hypothetical protein
MSSPSQGPKLRDRGCRIEWLVEPDSIANQDLVGPDDRRIRCLTGNSRRLEIRETQSGLFGRGALRSRGLLDGCFVDVSRPYLELET